jgi:sortase B
MKDLSMFGRLRYYKTGEEYTESHKFFQIYTGDRIYRYEIIGCRDISADSDIYVSFDLSDSDEIGLMQNEIMKGSYINSGETLSEDQRYVTLSTCSVDESVRFVVLGKQIEIIVHDAPGPQSGITDGL